jgi:hypothetical protein
VLQRCLRLSNPQGLTLWHHLLLPLHVQLAHPAPLQLLPLLAHPTSLLLLQRRSPALPKQLELDRLLLPLLLLALPQQAGQVLVLR